MIEDQVTQPTENDTPPTEAVFLDPNSKAGEPVDVGEPVAQERDWDAEARDMGWVPEDEFKGDKAKWRPAQEFVKRGEDFIPFLKADKKKLEEKLAKERDENEKRIKRLENAQLRSTEALKKQHEKELANISSEMKKAVSEGDVATYEKLETQRDELAKQKIDEPTSGDPETVQKEWVAKNDWYNNDFELNREATEYSQFLAQRNPNISLDDNLSQTEAFIKQKHPDKFGDGSKRKTAANGHAAVDGGGIMNGSPPRKASLFDKLPKEAKAQFNQDVSEGLFKKTDGETWAKTYNS